MKEKGLMTAVLKFLDNPAAWWEERKRVIVFRVIFLTLLRVLIDMDIIDPRSVFACPAIWVRPWLFLPGYIS